MLSRIFYKLGVPCGCKENLVEFFNQSIKRLNSLINFYNDIGFDDPIKQNKLKQIIIIKGGTVRDSIIE